MAVFATIDKSRAKKKQTIKGTNGDDSIIGSKYADKIYTGDGYDDINPGKGKDTIIINGQGEKRIIIDGYSNNTIKFSGDMSSTKTVLDMYYGIYLYRKKGNDLYIGGVSFENGKKPTQTIVNFFGNESVLQNLYIYDGDEESKLNKEIFGLEIYGDKKRNVVGTNNDNEDNYSYYGEYLNGSKKADKVYTGTGRDYITAGKGNDKIYLNGGGVKDIIIRNGDGNDTIYVNELTQDINLMAPGTVAYRKEISNDGKDLILYRTFNSGKSTKTEKTTIKDFYVYSKAFSGDDSAQARLFIKGIEFNNNDMILNWNKNSIVNMKKTYTIDSTETKNIFIGTKKADNVTVNYNEGLVPTILTGAGNDTITVQNGFAGISGGAGNDTINVETTGNTYIYHSTGDGNDTITTTDEGNIYLNINVQGKAFNNYDQNLGYYNDYFIASRQGFSFKGDDLVLQIPSGMNKFETITIKNFSSINPSNVYVNMAINGNEYSSDSLLYMLQNNSWVFWSNGVYDSTSKRTIYNSVDLQNTNFYYSGKGKATMYGDSKENTYIANFNKKSNLIISDSFSSEDEYDALIIKASKNNLRAFFNVDKYGRVSVSSYDDKSDDFFIFNKKNLTAKNVKSALAGNGTGFIDIDKFFRTSSGSTFRTGDGLIEEIVVGKNVTDKFAKGYTSYFDLEMKCFVDTDEWIYNVVSDVAGWLSKHAKYSDSFDVIQNGSAKDIASLLKVYAGEKPPTYM